VSVKRYDDGKTSMDAMRALKRRLSDVVYRQLLADAPGRTPGGDCHIQRGRLTPRHRHFGSVASRTRHQQA
jgi:hypothetical protein